MPTKIPIGETGAFLLFPLKFGPDKYENMIPIGIPGERKSNSHAYL